MADTAGRWALPFALAFFDAATVASVVLTISGVPPFVQAPWLFLLPLVLALGAHVGWYALACHDLAPLTRTQWTYGLWAFLLIVPIASLVSLYKLAEEIRRAQIARGVHGMGSIGVFLWNFLPFSSLPLGLPPFINAHGVFVAQRQVNRILRGLEPSPQDLGLRVGDRRTFPELLPMPASGFLALLLGWASVPLALTGPAGVLAGLGSVFFRSRFGRLEATVAGHRGAGLVAKLPAVVAFGIIIGAGVTIGIGARLVWITVVSAK